MTASRLIISFLFFYFVPRRSFSQISVIRDEPCWDSYEEEFLRSACTYGSTDNRNFTKYYNCNSTIVAKSQNQCRILPAWTLRKGPFEVDLQCCSIDPNRICDEIEESDHFRTCACKAGYFPDFEGEDMCLRDAQSKMDTCSKDSQCFYYFGFNATCTEVGFCTNITHAEDIGGTNCGLIGAGITGTLVFIAVVILICRRRQRASAAVAADDTD